MQTGDGKNAQMTSKIHSDITTRFGSLGFRIFFHKRSFSNWKKSTSGNHEYRFNLWAPFFRELKQKRFRDFSSMADADWGWGFGPNLKRGPRITKRFRDFGSMADAEWGWGFGPNLKRDDQKSKRLLIKQPNVKYFLINLIKS